MNSSQSSGRNDIVPDRYGDVIGSLYRVAAMKPAHEPYRHTGPLHAAMALPSPSEFSPSYRKLRTGMLRDVIVAGRSRKSSASFGTPAIVAVNNKYRTGYVRRSI
jgi:hypothetical protein